MNNFMIGHSFCVRRNSYARRALHAPVRINMRLSLLRHLWCAFPRRIEVYQKDKWLFTIPYKCITSLFYCHQKCHNSNDGVYTITTATATAIVICWRCAARACAMLAAHDNAHRGVFIFTRCRLNLLSWCTLVTFWQQKFWTALKWSRKHSFLVRSYYSRKLIQFTLSSAAQCVFTKTRIKSDKIIQFMSYTHLNAAEDTNLTQAWQLFW